MKRITLFSLKALRVSLIIIAASTLAISFLSFTAKRKLAGDIWQQLGITRQRGEQSIQTGFLRGYLEYFNASSIRTATSGNRQAITQDLLQYTRQYITSDAFKKAYEQERIASKPVAPEKKEVRTRQQIQAAEVAKMEQSLREMEENVKKMDPAMQKDMQEGLQTMKQLIKEYKDPNNQMFEYMVMSEKQELERKQKEYEESLTRWNKEVPADHNQLVKARLQEFISATDGIDYNAALKDSYGKKKFINQAYERKNDKWKMGFRAGKEVTEYARTFAKEWIAQIN